MYENIPPWSPKYGMEPGELTVEGILLNFAVVGVMVAVLLFILNKEDQEGVA